MSITHTFPAPTDLGSALARAFARARAERIFAYPKPDGRWLCKHYTITVTGPGPLDVECDCADAVFRERICKHAISVVFCRLYRLLPWPPALGDAQTVLPDCLDDFLDRLTDTAASAA